MIALSPTARLQAIARADSHATSLVDDILRLYVDFLQVTDAPKGDLLARFEDSSYRAGRHESGVEFGDRVFDLLRLIGEGTPLFRYLVV